MRLALAADRRNLAQPESLGWWGGRRSVN
jgi:hypothetical protein